MLNGLDWMAAALMSVSRTSGNGMASSTTEERRDWWLDWSYATVARFFGKYLPAKDDAIPNLSVICFYFQGGSNRPGKKVLVVHVSSQTDIQYNAPTFTLYNFSGCPRQWSTKSYKYSLFRVSRLYPQYPPKEWRHSIIAATVSSLFLFLSLSGRGWHYQESLVEYRSKRRLSTHFQTDMLDRDIGLALFVLKKATVVRHRLGCRVD